jgi:hypothetical protein
MLSWEARASVGDRDLVHEVLSRSTWASSTNTRRAGQADIEARSGAGEELQHEVVIHLCDGEGC